MIFPRGSDAKFPYNFKRILHGQTFVNRPTVTAVFDMKKVNDLNHKKLASGRFFAPKTVLQIIEHSSGTILINVLLTEYESI